MKTNLTSKITDLSKISSPNFASVLRSPYTSLFLQYNPIGPSYGPNFFFFLAYRSSSGVPFKYLERSRKVKRKLFRGASTKVVSSQKITIRRNFNLILRDLTIDLIKVFTIFKTAQTHPKKFFFEHMYFGLFLSCKFLKILNLTRFYFSSYMLFKRSYLR